VEDYEYYEEDEPSKIIDSTSPNGRSSYRKRIHSSRKKLSARVE
jgi:hypothetical protein